MVESAHSVRSKLRQLHHKLIQLRSSCLSSLHEDSMKMTFSRKLDDGQVVSAKVIKKLDTFEAQNHQKLQFLLKLEGSAEEVIDCMALCDKIEEMVADEEANPDRPLHTFKEILGHQGPLKPSDPNCKGSSCNVRLRWEDRSEIDEPLGIVGKDDALACADCARKHGLLDTPGWKFLCKHGCQTRKLQRMLKQARATAAKNAPILSLGCKFLGMSMKQGSLK